MKKALVFLFILFASSDSYAQVNSSKAFEFYDGFLYILSNSKDINQLFLNFKKIDFEFQSKTYSSDNNYVTETFVLPDNEKVLLLYNNSNHPISLTFLHKIENKNIIITKLDKNCNSDNLINEWVNYNNSLVYKYSEDFPVGILRIDKK